MRYHLFFLIFPSPSQMGCCITISCVYIKVFVTKFFLTLVTLHYMLG